MGGGGGKQSHPRPFRRQIWSGPHDVEQGGKCWRMRLWIVSSQIPERVNACKAGIMIMEQVRELPTLESVTRVIAP